MLNMENNVAILNCQSDEVNRCGTYVNAVYAAIVTQM